MEVSSYTALLAAANAGSAWAMGLGWPWYIKKVGSRGHDILSGDNEMDMMA